MSIQVLAFAAKVLLIRQAPLRRGTEAAKLAINLPEDSSLELRDPTVIYAIRGSPAREARSHFGTLQRGPCFGRGRELRYRVDVEIDPIEEQATRRTVRAGAVAPVRRRVKRAQTHEAGSAIGQAATDTCHVGEVADSPVR